MKILYIYGASGHGLVVSDIAKACGYKKTIFIDDGDNDFMSFSDIKNNVNIPIIIAIGSNKIRETLFKKVSLSGFDIISLIHPSVIISDSSEINAGTVIMPNVVINANSRIGKGVILNTSCIVEHDNNIESFVHISPNVGIAGNVVVKKLTHIGIGSSVIQKITIGENCIIGAGSVVVRDITSNNIAYGNPCVIVKGNNE